MSVRAFSDPQPERCSQDGQCASLGLGAIALPLAQRLKAFKVRLTGVTRDPSSPKLSAFGLDACFRVSEREQAFSEADVLILCTRYFTGMRGTIGMHELNCLPQEAYLVNIARGGLVDNRALHHALVYVVP